MQTKMIVAASVVLALGMPVAHAGDFYALGAVGQSKLGVDKGAFDNDLRSIGATGLSSSVSDSDTAYKLQLGYQFNENFALEGGYFNLGKAEYRATANQGRLNAGVKADGWNLSAVGTLPLTEQFSVLGKVGAAYSTAKGEFSVVSGTLGASGSESDTKFGLTYGAGVAYNFTKAVALRAEYEVYDKVGGDDVGESNVNVLSLGLAFKF